MDKVRGNSLATKMKYYLVKFDKALLEQLDQYKDSAFFAPLRHAIEGGKRLRPILLILSFESVGGRGKDPLPAAVAVELAHTESLIHDDILDGDDLRRNAKAFHALYGYDMALLSADFILSMIFDMATRYMNSRITKAMAQAVFRMCEGEFEELKVHKRGETLSLERYIEIIMKKTASLFEASAMVGAIIGGAGGREVEALSDYGRLLGVAYQIQDDISDLDKDKIVKYLQFSNTNLGKAEYLREKAKSYVQEAKQRLNGLKESNAKNLLIELADYIAELGEMG